MKPAREKFDDEDDDQKRSTTVANERQVIGEQNEVRSSRCIPADSKNDAAKETKEAQVRVSSMWEEAIMSLNAKTSIKPIGSSKPRHSKRIRPPSARSQLPYRSAHNWSAHNWSAQFEAMSNAGLIVLVLATCLSFALANSTNQEGDKPKEPSSIRTRLDGGHLAGASLMANGATNELPSSARPFGRRSKRATVKSQTGASSVGARMRSTTNKPAAASRQQTSAEVEPLVQQQQQASGKSIKNVTAQNDQSVVLHCLVEPNAAGELPEVSWFRGSNEPQLLTYDTTTIIRDERFHVRQGVTRPNDWALQIKSLNKTTDAGLYQCQTSGDSPQLQSYQLNIVEPQVDIIGAPDLTVRVGSPINLTCVISPSVDEPGFVFWYRDERMINYDFPDQSKGKIVASKWPQRDSITSNLQIFQSRLTDSGNYTCAPSGARSSSIQVHVLQATDKRLMMFQQDESNPLAASSRQTNSAISAHVIRLSHGRAYAFLVGFFILATWFQLIAQLQTLVSLFLVAIIGLLLSQQGARTKHQQQKPLGDDEAGTRLHLKRSPGGEQLNQPKLGDDDGQHKSGQPFKSSALALGLANADTTRICTETKHQKDTSDGSQDRLLRGTERALSLLRTFSVENSERPIQIDGALSCSSVEFDDEDNCSVFRSLSFAALDHRQRDGHQFATPEQQRAPKTSPERRLSIAPDGLTGRGPDDNLDKSNTNDRANDEMELKSNCSQASPSSSSCSPASVASTGYNSDSTRPCSSSTGGAGGCMQTTPTSRQSVQTSMAARRTPNVSLLDGAQAHDGLEPSSCPEPEVIELIKGRPTAMRLIIEHLRKTGQLGDVPLGPGPSSTNSMGRSCGHRPMGKPNEPVYSIPGRRTLMGHANEPGRTHHQDRHDGQDDDDETNCPLDLSRRELARRSASATFQRPD